MKTKPHVVAQGEYLSKLAFRYGFDAAEVWNDAHNDELRNRRPNPEILCPGDVLHVPANSADRLPVTTGGVNRFKASVPTVKMIVRFRDNDGAMANEPYEVPRYGVKGTTDAQGQIDVDVPVIDRAVEVLLPHRGWSRTFLVGDLDPIEETSGVRGRLRHLGYLSESDDPDAEHRAITAFQTDRRLNATGVLDSATLDALVKAHEGTP